MKKAYATPVAEKIQFRYSEQIAESPTIPSLTCTQSWIGLNEESIATCSHKVVIQDSGF